jgi:hypothetical protein
MTEKGEVNHFIAISNTFSRKMTIFIEIMLYKDGIMLTIVGKILLCFSPCL